MDFFDALIRKKINHHPGVWISRVALYSKILPETVEIRNIELYRGFNIICAEENEDEGPEAEITGHSAGKTTFCRLIRYLLGENFHPQNKTMRQIREVFPQGYVAGELHIRKDSENRTAHWAVIRPIGKNKFSYILEDETIETLIKNRKYQVTQETYSQKLGLDALLCRMGTDRIVRTNDPIEWGHLLAWCTRDQENRFQNIHEWRSPRSEHGAPSFKFPRSGPLFVMRAALGLFLPDELKGEKDLAFMYNQKEGLERKLESFYQEPKFRINLHKGAIRTHIEKILKQKLPENLKDFETQPMVYSDSLEAYLNEIIRKTETELDQMAEKSERLQNEMDGLGSEIKQIERQLTDLELELSKEDQKSHEMATGSNWKKKEMESAFYERCAAFKIYNTCQTFLDELEIVRLNDKRDELFYELKIKESHSKIAQLKEEQIRLKNLKSNVVEQHLAVKKERDEFALSQQNFKQRLNDLDLIRK